jgi:hypothetical protein
MRIFASEVLVVYRAPEISRTMNSLPLEFMDLIHAGNLLRHDGQKVFNDAARDMLTISQIEVLPGMMIQRFIRHDSSKVHLLCGTREEILNLLGPSLHCFVSLSCGIKRSRICRRRHIPSQLR